MSDTFINVDDLEWVTTKIIKEHSDGPEESHPWLYELDLFKPLADWDVFSYWENERIASMQEHIKQGDIVFDVGAEQGWMSALISKYMSSEIVLVEPTAEFWPGIKALFKRNKLEEPLDCYAGFFNDKQLAEGTELDSEARWPVEANQLEVIEKRKYRNLFDKHDVGFVRGISLDDFAGSRGVFPDHITIDVEGAELLVLKGAEQTLREHRPKVWVSIHPDLLIRDYATTKEDVYFFMDECEYDAELLAIDHEWHVLFTPKK